jgi:hypothetical protein
MKKRGFLLANLVSVLAPPKFAKFRTGCERGIPAKEREAGLPSSLPYMLLTWLTKYITRLEDENKDLHKRNYALVEGNARSLAFIKKVLQHPALAHFLRDFSEDEIQGNSIW